jgi:hypothetical protein
MLFRAKRNHGVDSGGPSRRDPCRRRGYGSQNNQHAAEGNRIRGTDTEEKTLNGSRQKDGREAAQQQSRGGEGQRL